MNTFLPMSCFGPSMIARLIVSCSLVLLFPWHEANGWNRFPIRV